MQSYWDYWLCFCLLFAHGQGSWSGLNIHKDGVRNELSSCPIPDYQAIFAARNFKEMPNIWHHEQVKSGNNVMQMKGFLTHYFPQLFIGLGFSISYVDLSKMLFIKK